MPKFEIIIHIYHNIIAFYIQVILVRKCILFLTEPKNGKNRGVKWIFEKEN